MPSQHPREDWPAAKEDVHRESTDSGCQFRYTSSWVSGQPGSYAPAQLRQRFLSEENPFLFLVLGGHGTAPITTHEDIVVTIRASHHNTLADTSMNRRVQVALYNAPCSLAYYHPLALCWREHGFTTITTPLLPTFEASVSALGKYQPVEHSLQANHLPGNNACIHNLSQPMRRESLLHVSLPGRSQAGVKRYKPAAGHRFPSSQFPIALEPAPAFPNYLSPPISILCLSPYAAQNG